MLARSSDEEAAASDAKQQRVRERTEQDGAEKRVVCVGGEAELRHAQHARRVGALGQVVARTDRGHAALADPASAEAIAARGLSVLHARVRPDLVPFVGRGQRAPWPVEQHPQVHGAQSIPLLDVCDRRVRPRRLEPMRHKGPHVLCHADAVEIAAGMLAEDAGVEKLAQDMPRVVTAVAGAGASLDVRPEVSALGVDGARHSEPRRTAHQDLAAPEDAGSIGVVARHGQARVGGAAGLGVPGQSTGPVCLQLRRVRGHAQHPQLLVLLALSRGQLRQRQHFALPERIDDRPRRRAVLDQEVSGRELVGQEQGAAEQQARLRCGEQLAALPAPRVAARLQLHLQRAPRFLLLLPRCLAARSDLRLRHRVGFGLAAFLGLGLLLLRARCRRSGCQRPANRVSTAGFSADPLLQQLDLTLALGQLGANRRLPLRTLPHGLGQSCWRQGRCFADAMESFELDLVRQVRTVPADALEQRRELGRVRGRSAVGDEEQTVHALAGPRVITRGGTMLLELGGSPQRQILLSISLRPTAVVCCARVQLSSLEV
eukprot:1441669-Rhodomonas_salina.1